MRHARTPFSLAAAVLLALGIAHPGAAVVDVSTSRHGIAIAPFSGTSGTLDGELPDVGDVLARALGANSTLRVVPPGSLRRDDPGQQDVRIPDLPLDLPRAETVRHWADWNQVENVVVGRTEGLDMTVELRSGHSGGALAEYRLAPASRSELSGAVQRLALLILADLGERSATMNDALPPVSVAGPQAPEASAGAAADEPTEDSLALLPGPRRDDPISINSDELEVLPEGGGRRLVFSNNVEVLQGDITLNADRLEAVYPPGASQPDRLIATGHVRVNQGDRRARCEEATYERTANTIVCRGKAEVTQGCDRVRGEEIEFDLVRERVRVSGAASVVIQAVGSAEECADGFMAGTGAGS